MSKKPSEPEPDLEVESMAVFQVCKKLKRFILFEPHFGFLGFFFISCCLICYFVFMDDSLLDKAFVISDQPESSVWLQKNGSDRNQKMEFLAEEGSGCDVFNGDWVWDETYPLYNSTNCPFLDDGFRCSENGRPDSSYAKWRWQPKDCNLPRFDATKILETLRNKRVAFVGDSIGRNQWESLLCMLSSGVSNKDSIFEVNGYPITKHKGSLVFLFKDYNSTVEYYRAPFLVLQSRPPPGSPPKIKTTLKLDRIDWSSSKWRDADLLVLNSGHWWNYEKTIRGGCYFQEGEDVKMEMKVEEAYHKSLETLVHWTHDQLNLNKTRVFFRTYSPVHFRGGDWKSGGNCHLETVPDGGDSLVPAETWSRFAIANQVLSPLSSNSSKFKVLNVTALTARRKDGHSSVYYLGPRLSPAPIHRQDCSHWCLPGVPDIWNELMLAFFFKSEFSRSTDSLTRSDM